MTATELAARLTDAGIAASATGERDEAADAGVNLGGDRYIQIAGPSLFLLHRWDKSEGASYPLGNYRSVADLADAIRKGS